MKVELCVPHFLRVTQALAFVSGFGLPIIAGCGSTSAPTTGGESDGASSEDAAYEASIIVGGGIGIPPYDGGPTGVVANHDAAIAYDGAVTGIGIYDGGPTGVAVQPDSSTVYDGGPLGIIVPFDGGHVVAGGPLAAPELPA
jgi:hypothetical protein